MQIKIHRIYDESMPQGYHALIDRIWPRGISKEEAQLNAHWKELAPSDELRKWFDHDPEKWSDFRKKYLAELSDCKSAAKECLDDVDTKNLILLYGAKDKKHTHAHVLKEYLERLG